MYFLYKVARKGWDFNDYCNFKTLYLYGVLRIGFNVFFHMLYKILLFPFISLKISFTLTYFTLKSILLYYDCPMLFGLFFLVSNNLAIYGWRHFKLFTNVLFCGSPCINLKFEPCFYSKFSWRNNFETKESTLHLKRAVNVRKKCWLILFTQSWCISSNIL